MTTIHELETEIKAIKLRNARVEADKAWETSWARTILLSALTYLVSLAFFLVSNLPDPYLNSLVTAIAYIISSFTLAGAKNMWLHKAHEKKQS